MLQIFRDNTKNRTANLRYRLQFKNAFVDVKKRNRNLKQIFALSIDSLRERKVRSALTIVMVVIGSAFVVPINAISAGSAAFMDKQIGSLAQMYSL
jgi:hypothetical protein